MFKTCVTIALTFFFLFTGFNSDASAATRKKKKKATDGKYVSHRRSKKYARNSKSRRHRGSSVDLRALTTESPYSQNPDNGVNPVETKPGIQ